MNKCAAVNQIGIVACGLVGEFLFNDDDESDRRDRKQLV